MIFKLLALGIAIFQAILILMFAWLYKLLLSRLSDVGVDTSTRITTHDMSVFSLQSGFFYLWCLMYNGETAVSLLLG